MACTVNGQRLDSLFNKGDSLLEVNNFAGADAAFSACLKEALSLKDSTKAGNVYMRLGMVFENQSIFSKSLEFCFKGLALFQLIGAKERIAAANNNIGEVYRKLGDYKQGLTFLNRSYGQYLALGDSAKIPYVLNNIGSLHVNEHNEDKAYFNFQLVLTKYAKHLDQEVMYSAMTNAALVLLRQKQYAKSLEYFRKCLKLRKALGDEFRTAIILCNMSELYMETRDYNTALRTQQEGLRLAKKTGRLKLMKWGYTNLSKIYEATGDYSLAYASIVKSMALQDSINSEIKNEYRFAEENYKRQQKEIENRNLQQEGSLQALKIRAAQASIEYKNRLLVISIFVIALILLTVFLLYKAYRTRQANERILQKQQTMILENQLKDWELTALRAQMNPHFIFNALSSIKSYILEQNIHLADYYLSKFAKLIRLILDNSSHKRVPLEKELQLLESYIQLEQLRFDDKFTYNFNIDKEINTMETFIPPMLIQPFVENAIIHGFRDKQEKCNLQVKVTHCEYSVIIVVEDNGVGRLQAKARSRDGFHESKGYKMTAQRLEALGKNNGAAGSIVYRDLRDDSGNTGTRVEIRIPLQEFATTA